MSVHAVRGAAAIFAAALTVLIWGAIGNLGAGVARGDVQPGGTRSVRISQIDTASLLVNQTVRVYVAASDAGGNPVTNLKKEDFSLFEAAGSGPAQAREILRFRQGANINEGINLLLVLDNSGSMYWDGTGREKSSPDPEVWRITYAKEAIIALLGEIRNPRDRVGIITFNVKIQSRTLPTGDRSRLLRVLEETSKPSGEEAYTELYETLHEAVGSIRGLGGRRVIVLLSDGQDFPLRENPDFPKRRGIEGAIDYAQREGISVFTIGLSAKADRTNLSRIARETGGAYFSAYDPRELRGLYAMIRNQILNEYLITYKAAMVPAEKKLVRLSVGDGKRLEAERFYYSATLFGTPVERLSAALFLFIPAGVVLLFVLSRIRFINKRKEPTLSVLTPSGRTARGATLALQSSKTRVTIGGGPKDDLTISGDPKIGITEAAIERKGDSFTLVAGAHRVTVNNKPVRTKALRSGDVIRVGDTTVVFDEGRGKG